MSAVDWSSASSGVDMVGVAHPSPAKAALFESVDLASAQVAARAAMAAGVRHIVYVSVARPAPVETPAPGVRSWDVPTLRRFGRDPDGVGFN